MKPKPNEKPVAKGSGGREFFAGLVVGAILSLGTAWYFVYARHQPGVRHAQDVTAVALQQTAIELDAKLSAMHLTSADIREELSRTGKVVRQSVHEFGVAAADVAADARVTAMIKAKLAADKELSALTIAVSTTGGVVTLAGTVSSERLIGKAVLLANETHGVRKVSSTLQVKN